MILLYQDKIRYELDLTAKSPDNLVSDEKHVTANLRRRIIVPKYGCFYGSTLKITDLKSGKEVPKTSYSFDDESEAAAMRTGKECYTTIILHDSTVSNEVSLSYQVVGGEFSVDDMEAIYNKIMNANFDNRPVSWENISGKPSAFKPTEHLHPAEQWFGMEHLVYVMERLVYANLTGDEASHDVIWDSMKKLDKKVDDVNKATNDRINLHLNDKKNPHEVNPHQIGTLTEAEIRTLNKGTDDKLNSHITDKNNPHKVNPHQIGTLETAEIRSEITAAKKASMDYTTEHKNDKKNPHGVNPHQIGTLTRDEIISLTNGNSADLAAHINDKKNPHGVTPGQIGATTEADVIRLINQTNQSGVGADLSRHIADKKNPHGVTVEQIGTLSAVQIRAEIKVVNDAFLLHKNDKKNPHNVTAEQLKVYTKAETDLMLKNYKVEIETLINNKIGNIVDGNGQLNVNAIPVSKTAGQELVVKPDGLYFQVAESPWAVKNGWVTKDGVKIVWRNKAGTEQKQILPTLWA